MNKIITLIVVLASLQGCSMMRRGVNINPALANLNANEDINAVKLQGDVAPIKGPVAANADANVQGALGMNNSVSDQRTSAGRDMVVSNDTALLRENLVIYEKLTERYIKLMRYVVYVLFTVASAQFAAMIALIGWAIKFLLRADRERDRRIEDKGGRS